MGEKDGGASTSEAVLFAVAVAVTGFLPATFLYETVTRWLRPMQHAEEAMGRGMEVLFIGGPTLFLSVAAGWVAHRSRSPWKGRVAVGFIAACLLATLAVAKWTALVR